MNALATTDEHGILERVIAVGDLAQLTTAERNEYYFAVCRSAGLNPTTRPFEYLRLSNKLVLYARRDAADQLRKINRISLRVVSRETVGDLYVVTVEARDADGRVDSDIGAVAIGGLRGEALANALLKATTKAKRRVTLAISGLGVLDETEVSDIPRRERQEWSEPRTAGQIMVQAAMSDLEDLREIGERIDRETGEVAEPDPTDPLGIADAGDKTAFSVFRAAVNRRLEEARINDAAQLVFAYKARFLGKSDRGDQAVAEIEGRVADAVKARGASERMAATAEAG